MSNTLSVYDPIFYAQEGLIQLEKALGMASRVHRGYERERNARERGSVISIPRPSTFSADNAPSSAQNVTAGSVSISLDQWKEVKFALTDQELAYTSEKIIADHIRPAAYALADQIDQDLCALVKQVPWFVDAAGSASSTPDLTGVYRTLFGNAVPVGDPSMVHVMVDGIEQEWLQLNTAFSQLQTAGQAGLDTLLKGSLGIKFGMEIFANQNVTSHTKGTCNDTALQVKGNTSAGATTIDLDAVDGTVTGTLVPGDTFVIAGNTQRYAITGTFTAASNEFLAVTFVPALAAAVLDNAAVTVNLDNHTEMVGFHRNAFALAMAPLPTMARELGAKVETAIDPVTGLALRARMFYIGDTSKVYVALDVLYGVKTLDPNLACKLRG
jgi:hypothetical protein